MVRKNTIKIPAVHRITKKQLLDLLKKYMLLVEGNTGEDWVSQYDPKTLEQNNNISSFEYEVLISVAQVMYKSD